MAAEFLKGALVSFMPTFVGAVPNVIVFQYNPETITHGWTAPSAHKDPNAKAAANTTSNPLAASGIPGETFSFTLSLDSNEMIADGRQPGATFAQGTGVYTRLAALEMLQYPSDALSSASSPLLGSVSSAIKGALNISSSATVPASQVPVVLFVWGPSRIVPVRVTSLSIAEKLYDRLLNPIHADVTVALRVLTPDEIEAVQAPMKDIAKVAYVYSQGLRQVQAVANLGDAASTIIGMLPSPF